mmetsp:Transcript_30307/g.77292  ORF Transcript_30307/g.77292 Transcript_30307/m.77292 type:complete len:314 (+) Transcript_30307:1759-2700(+)
MSALAGRQLRSRAVQPALSHRRHQPLARLLCLSMAATLQGAGRKAAAKLAEGPRQSWPAAPSQTATSPQASSRAPPPPAAATAPAAASQGQALPPRARARARVRARPATTVGASQRPPARTGTGEVCQTMGGSRRACHRAITQVTARRARPAGAATRGAWPSCSPTGRWCWAACAWAPASWGTAARAPWCTRAAWTGGPWRSSGCCASSTTWPRRRSRCSSSATSTPTWCAASPWRRTASLCTWRWSAAAPRCPTGCPRRRGGQRSARPTGRPLSAAWTPCWRWCAGWRRCTSAASCTGTSSRTTCSSPRAGA